MWLSLRNIEGKKDICPFLLLENSRPLSPFWEPQTPISSLGTPDFLSTCPGIDSLTIHIASLEKCVLNLLPMIKGVSSLFYCWAIRVTYIFRVKVLYWTYNLKYFLHVSGLSFHFLSNFFWSTKIWNLMRCKLLIFLWDVLLMLYLGNLFKKFLKFLLEYSCFTASFCYAAKWISCMYVPTPSFLTSFLFRSL